VQRPRLRIQRIRSGERGAKTEFVRATCFVDGGRRILERQRRRGVEARGARRAEVGDPVIVDAAVPHRELGIVDGRQGQREPAVQDGHVDAFRIEHVQSRTRIEAGTMAVRISPAATEVGERRTRIAEAHQSAVRDEPILDPRFVVARRRVPSQAERRP
jgi:hypothetical protein